MTDEPLLSATDVSRVYQVSDDVEVRALDGVSFDIRAGDSTAIVGTSGSGKSTLLNLLGALDRPTSGVVAFRGRDVRDFDDGELATLRNERIGFVFQSFHLLSRQSAVDNVALPLVYRRGSRKDRRRRAEEALASVGLADRLDHRPTELSGGQQQRVAIARALVTEPDLVLADEPTGNLDTATGEEVMALLDALNRDRGVAVVTITHDREVAEHARRVIELRDGRVVDDRVGRQDGTTMGFGEALRVSLQSLVANRLRSVLTTLGVVIGVLAVVLLVAIGQGARQEITRTIEGLGSNLLFVFPGSGDFTAAPARSKFDLQDVDRLARALEGEDRVAAYLISGETVRSGSDASFATVFGVTDGYTDVVVREVTRGTALTSNDLATGHRVAVIGTATAEQLFDGDDPIGRTMTIAGLRFRVVGVLETVGASFLGPDRDEQILIPITAAQRIFATDRVDAIFVKATSTGAVTGDAATIERVLAERLDDEDFSVLTQDDIIGVVGDILELLTFVLAAIAGISLLVGGVGVSNIMLVSVQERTREIGLRKALGARTRDITLQFLLESIALTGLGGALGLGLGLLLALLVDRFAPVPAVVTGWSVALALGVSIAVGVFFGVWPARRAGRLDPDVALRHD